MAKKINVAQFRFNSAFPTARRPFFLVGEITDGSVRVGNYMDLSALGLPCMPRIESVEFVRKWVDGRAVEMIGLGTNDLDDAQRAFLQQKDPVDTPFDIWAEMII